MSGVVELREKPRTDLLGLKAFVIDADATRADLLAFASWVESNGGKAPYIDDNGVLVVSVNPEPDERDYYAFIERDALVVINVYGEYREFSEYGSTMADHYEVVGDAS